MKSNYVWERASIWFDFKISRASARYLADPTLWDSHITLACKEGLPIMIYILSPKSKDVMVLYGDGEWASLGNTRR